MTVDGSGGDGNPEEFCRRLHPRLVRALYLQFEDPALAEDLAQEALARAWERWPRLSGMEAPDAWVFRVAFNLRTSFWRRRQTERQALDRQRSRSSAAEAAPGDDLADAITVRAAVRALPDRERAAIVLRYFADLSVDQVADVLRCRPGTVKSLTSKAIDNLRRELDVNLSAPVEEEAGLHA